MEITWLGQGGFLFATKKLKIMIDPYFSDAAEKINSDNYRRVPVNEEMFGVKPDVLIITHCHVDHYDPETIRRYLLAGKDLLVLSPSSVWNDVRKNGGSHNYVLFDRYTQWTEKGVVFTAVKAEHSDSAAIGVIIDDGNKKYYITGDTLYNEKNFDNLPKDIYAVFLPVNGRGNNMNMDDAKRFAERIRAEVVIPMHCGMFDDIDMNRFECDKKRVPVIYQKMNLGEG